VPDHDPLPSHGLPRTGAPSSGPRLADRLAGAARQDGPAPPAVAPPSRDAPWRRRPPLTPCPTSHLHHRHRRPLHVTAAKASSPPARQVPSNSARSTANPGQGLAGESTPRYFSPPPWPKLLELRARTGYRLTRAYKWRSAVPRITLNNHKPSLPSLDNGTPPPPKLASSPPPADPPPRAAPTQGEHRNRTPSAPSPFCPIHRMPPRTGRRRAPLTGRPPAWLSPTSVLDSSQGGRRAFCPGPPASFPFSSNPLPYSLSLPFLSFSPYPLSYSTKIHPALYR
jgi:hypothetical protein